METFGNLQRPGEWLRLSTHLCAIIKRKGRPTNTEAADTARLAPAVPNQIKLKCDSQ